MPQYLLMPHLAIIEAGGDVRCTLEDGRRQLAEARRPAVEPT